MPARSATTRQTSASKHEEEAKSSGDTSPKSPKNKKKSSSPPLKETPAQKPAVKAFRPVTPWHKRPYDVLLFGPTGFTGRRVVQRLGTMELSVAVAGRHADPLKELVRENNSVQVAMLADVDDHESMVKAFMEARVVINCVGPFLDHGHQAVDAAIEARTWMIDPSGEQPWMNQLFRRHRELSEAGILVVTGMAAMPGLGDLAMYLLQPAFEEVAHLHVGYQLSGASPGRGTMKAMARYLGEPGLIYEDGFWRVARLGELNYTFRRGKEKINAISYPAGEAVLVPRHLEVEDVVGYVTTQGPGALFLRHTVPQIMRLMTPEVGRTLSELVERLPEALFSADEEHHNKCTTLLDVEGSLGGEPLTLRGGITAEDAYDTTADLLAYGAYFLVFKPPRERGALAPSQAFDAYNLLQLLGARGVSIDGALCDVLHGLPVTANPYSE